MCNIADRSKDKKIVLKVDKKKPTKTIHKVSPKAKIQTKSTKTSSITPETLKLKSEQSSASVIESPKPSPKLNPNEKKNIDLESSSESYDQNSLPSIYEEDDSKAESNSPKARMKKRSITNLRFEFQPNILVEADTPWKDEDLRSDSSRVHQNEAENLTNNYLNINVGKMKKQ